MDSEIEKLKAENEELKLAVEKLKTDLIHDELTGLKKRGFFTEKSRQDVMGIISSKAEHRKEGFESVSFLFCDIDHFKKINDNYGHDFGDEILKKVAQVLEENVRENDTVCRWGGEEIVISLLGADEKEAAEKADELRKAIEEKTKVSLSIGVSSFQPGIGFEELIKQADEAMYLAKAEGRNRVRAYKEK